MSDNDLHPSKRLEKLVTSEVFNSFIFTSSNDLHLEKNPLIEVIPERFIFLIFSISIRFIIPLKSNPQTAGYIYKSLSSKIIFLIFSKCSYLLNSRYSGNLIGLM